MVDENEAAPGLPVEAMLKDLAESGGVEKMQGVDLDALKRAMSAPGAAQTIAEIQSLGANSNASAGQRAPDFTLPYLPGHGGTEGDSVRLSDRFQNRPVALIFGSYT